MYKRQEVDSVPEELDEISRKIKQLEIEREAIKRENDRLKPVSYTHLDVYKRQH